jgi:hypothetical protein
MIIADLAATPGQSYPAGRYTRNLVGGASPIQATNFSLGNVTLEPNGVGIIMNGVTGRMGTEPASGRSILAIRKQGGVA